MRSRAKVAVIAGVCTAAVGAAGFGAYALVGGGSDDPLAVSVPGDRPTVKTGPPSAAEVRTVMRKFLGSWEKGDATGAASYTSDKKTAQSALLDYRKVAHISQVSLTPGTPKGSTVPFHVNATISYKDKKAPWTYESALKVTREKLTGRPVVDWQPSVVHPDLHDGDTLKTGESDAPPIKAVDRNGKALNATDHPTLRGVLANLRDRYGDKAGGQAGVETFIARAGGKGTDGKRPDQTLKVLSKGTPGTLKTTLDSTLQSKAEQAVKKEKKAGVVAVKPSTGEILALANSPEKGYNLALQAQLAPGSTMKVITSSLLLEKGLAAYDKPHPCPKYATYAGWKFHNDKKFEIKNGTFAQSFARSCNTAFITQAGKVGDDALTQEARDVFGIGLDWPVGVPTFDGRVPVMHGAAKAASMIGQGGVRMSPLSMASVSATAHTGSFHQPYLVSPDLDHRKLAQSSRPLKSDAADQLRRLMHLTATSGTAAQAMAGLSGDIGAKTGSAEVDAQKDPNGWFTAYRGDLAAAAVVPSGGHGGDSAGPIVAEILRAGG